MKDLNDLVAVREELYFLSFACLIVTDLWIRKSQDTKESHVTENVRLFLKMQAAESWEGEIQ